MLIETLKKDKKHCFKLELSDGRVCFIDSDVCAQYALHPQDEICEEKLCEIIKRSEFVRAKERALWYLDRCDRTEKELFEKLREAGFGEESVLNVLGFLKEYSLVDDRRFALNFTQIKAENNVSKREIKSKLYQKGISREIIDEVLENTQTDEYAQITALIEKKYRSRLCDKESTAKVFAALIRKGFSFSAVRDVLKQYNEELQYSEEF